ncbi:ribosomal RNA-processing protein 7-domain-containing protein [Chiua virens]|nr:ribosomal RNA-processing protein 7-domain-containing protein [Chiua virens]
MSTFPELISGFTVIPITYTHSTHVLYARAHRSKSQDVSYPEGRTLFLVNIPVDATDREISLFFKACGTVERVVYDRDSESPHGVEEGDREEEQAGTDTTRSPSPGSPGPSSEHIPQPRSKKQRQPKETAPPSIVHFPSVSTRAFRKTGGIGHVIFLDASSLEKAVVPPTKPRPWPSSEEPRGLTHYAAVYDAQTPPLDIIKAHTVTWMERFDFDLAKTKQKSAYRKGEAIVDEEGFTLVTRGGAYGRTLGGGVGIASKPFEKAGQTESKKKKEPKEKETFYAFQKAENQRKALLNLRRNFEADKEQIEKLKQSRRFRPY